MTIKTEKDFNVDISETDRFRISQKSALNDSDEDDDTQKENNLFEYNEIKIEEEE